MTARLPTHVDPPGSFIEEELKEKLDIEQQDVYVSEGLIDYSEVTALAANYHDEGNARAAALGSAHAARGLGVADGPLQTIRRSLHLLRRCRRRGIIVFHAGRLEAVLGNSRPRRRLRHATSIDPGSLALRPVHGNG